MSYTLALAIVAAVFLPFGIVVAVFAHAYEPLLGAGIGLPLVGLLLWALKP